MTRFTALMFVGTFLISNAGRPAAAQPVIGGSVSQGNSEMQLLQNLIPHPYLYFGPSASVGGGYAPLAYRAEGGIDSESPHAIFSILGAYDNGHKTDDNDQPNPNGHHRYWKARPTIAMLTDGLGAWDGFGVSFLPRTTPREAAVLKSGADTI